LSLAGLASSTVLLACTYGAGIPTPRTGWRWDPVWDDGKAEKAVYEATRTLYGIERRYEATCYTNQEHVDERATVKSTDGKGKAVFKHHWSERVPTENYDYDFSVSSYTEVDSLRPYKLTVATQEDCGASFKQFWREQKWSEQSGGYRWWESVYLPDAGIRDGRIEPRKDLQLFDSLTLWLRDYPFVAPREIALRLLPSQKSNKACSWELIEAKVTYAGKESLELPIGKREAHKLELSDDKAALATFWFDAEDSAPDLHVLLRYAGPDGQTYRLKSLERSAYWERAK
jgi:hypothetical protein